MNRFKFRATLMLCTCIFFSNRVFSQIKVHSVTPTKTESSSDGKIVLSGTFDSKTSYNITFIRIGQSIDSIQSTPNGELLTISGLTPGIYTQITVKTQNSSTVLPGSVEVNDSNNSFKKARIINPTCGGNNGMLIIDVPDNAGTYIVLYVLDGEEYIYNTQKKDDLASDDFETSKFDRINHEIKPDNGHLNLFDFSAGAYTHIKVYSMVKKDESEKKVNNSGNDTFITRSIVTHMNIFPAILTNNNINCIGEQKTQFMTALFQNFTGIKDDAPSDFTQMYARLSQPLNKAEGIRSDATGGERFIPLRNIMFQLTYGNTDNFKMYTTNFFEKKYINRMDLYGRSYFNGSLNINLLTYLMPKTWSNHRGSMGHIYLDLISTLLVTNVTDTGTATTYFGEPSYKKEYNIKTNLAGLSLKARFNNVFHTNFQIEINPKLIWLFPSTKSFTTNLSPQNADVATYHDSIFRYQNSYERATLDGFIEPGKNVKPFMATQVLIQYNTGHDEKDVSNIFIKYDYVSNFVGNNTKGYHNNFWQFQIGYSKDITDIFRKKDGSAAKENTAPKPDEKPAAEEAHTEVAPIKIETISDNSFHTEIGKIIVDAENGINVRKNFFVNSESIAKAENGTVLEYSGYTSEGEDVDKKGNKTWYKIKDGGWVYSGNVKKETTNK